MATSSKKPYVPGPIPLEERTIPDFRGGLLGQQNFKQFPFNKLLHKDFVKSYDAHIRATLDPPAEQLNAEEKLEVWITRANDKYRELRGKWRGKLEDPQNKAVMWGSSLNSFRWIGMYHHSLRAIEYRQRKEVEVRAVDQTIFDDPLVLDRLSSMKVDSMWKSHTEWPLHMGPDGNFVLDETARTRIEGTYEVLLVDEPLKEKIWEEVGGGSPGPVRGPQKRTREPGDEGGNLPPTRRCVR
ncbi:hypothetical protein TWF481_011271 [Arthrobotrys musiformis]|uniref:Uncharacterized protein n=1 Tax=Arthrobotrys musiformis TaxID=47236 RepID=A0AAV9VZY4_9PEZI